MPIGVGAAILGAGALSAGTSLIGGSKGAKAASSAANEQARAAQAAAQAQVQAAQTAQDTARGIYHQNELWLDPFTHTGPMAQQELAFLTGVPGFGGSGGIATPGNPLTGQPLSYGGFLQPFQPTQAQLEATPGFQFTRDQGLKAVQNSFAAQGLGSSGAAMKGAANYAEGLASTTYQQQFNNYWTQMQNYYNMLAGQVNPSLQAASAIAGVGVNTSNQLVNSITGAGQAQAAGLTGAGAASAAGTVGSANALVSGLTGATSGINQTALLYSLYNSGMFGNPGANGLGNLGQGSAIFNPGGGPGPGLIAENTIGG